MARKQKYLICANAFNAERFSKDPKKILKKFMNVLQKNKLFTSTR